MGGAAFLTGFLVIAFAAYGMAKGDRDLLLEVWSLTKISATLLIAWGGGKGVLQLVSKIRFGDEERPG